MSSYGRSYFGEATARLSRLLSLPGEIPVKLNEGITPVLVLGDGTTPGMAGSRTRRWSMAAVPTGGVTSSNWGFKAVEPIVITQIYGILSTAGAISIAYLGPDAADPWSMTNPTAVLLDRNLNNERAPLTEGGTNAVAETAGVFARNYFSTTDPRRVLDQHFYMTPGSKILLRWAASITLTVTVQGHTF